ncbi:hypothetical protein S40288_05826 [Stachybotrys chartarum IBT 40288]|nr:hypothetical protein S40288_05826 [Stachybotrys chartarum IBT 40288]
MAANNVDSPRMVQLAASISEAVAKLQEALQAKGVASPSFDEDAPISLPKETIGLQDAILDATSELYDMLLEPMDLLFQQGAHNNMVCLQTISRHNIAAVVPAGGQASFSEIAAKTGLSTSMVRRILRHAMTLRIFREPKPGMVAHTQTSRWLASPATNAWMSTASEEMWPAAVKLLDAATQHPDSQEANETGFSLANNTSNTIYQVIGTDPSRAIRFATAMKAYAESPGYDMAYVLDHYDWASLGADVKVVDMGGSQGHNAIALATRFPNLDVTVQDMPQVIVGADAGVPAELRKRVHFMPHDFFAAQPVEANVYYCRWIFHNWSDKYATAMLKALVPALKAGSRILINEICMPEPGEIAHWREKDIRAVDLNMAAIFNSHERTVAQWKELLAGADARFSLQEVVSPPGSALSIIDVRWNA